MTAPRALLADIVDYAGLFPPTAADMLTAVANHVAYAASADAWMLGRFVVPVARLDDMRAALQSVAVRPDASRGDSPVVRIAAVLGPNAVSDIDTVRRFNDVNTSGAIRARVDMLEGKIADVSSIAMASAACAGSDGEALELFVEIPSNADPRTLITACQSAGVAAKLRMGGVTAGVFPPTPDVLRFIRCCIDEGVAFKATAGLHHPLSAEYRLTYDEGAACAGMYGFLNVFLTATAIKTGVDDEQATRLLTERRPAAFRWASESVAWESLSLTSDDLARARADIIRSFGSCSFSEPVNESRALGLIA